MAENSWLKMGFKHFFCACFQEQCELLNTVESDEPRRLWKSGQMLLMTELRYEIDLRYLD